MYEIGVVLDNSGHLGYGFAMFMTCTKGRNDPGRENRLCVA